MLPILRTRNGFPGLMNEFFDNDLLSSFLSKENKVPDVNVLKSEDGYKIEVAAPGLSKEDFKINLENDVITISSEKEFKNEENKDNYLRREFGYNSKKSSRPGRVGG